MRYLMMLTIGSLYLILFVIKFNYNFKPINVRFLCFISGNHVFKKAKSGKYNALKQYLHSHIETK